MIKDQNSTTLEVEISSRKLPVKSAEVADDGQEEATRAAGETRKQTARPVRAFKKNFNDESKSVSR